MAERTRLSDTELLERLVAFDTTTPNSNLPLIDFVADYLDGPGVRITPNASADGTRANLVVVVGPEPEGRDAGLTLSGHVDVVPAAEAEWRSDPFRLTARDGALFGRGSSDMKGFVALAVNAMAAIDPGRLRAPLALLLTYDEEIGLVGAKRFAETWPESSPLPRRTVVGEPTALEVVRAHKGFVDLRVTYTGTSAHSGYPHLGASAIEPAGRLIVGLSRLRETFQAERPAHAEAFPDVPYVSLNVGRVAGGVATNVVPDRCSVEISARPLPGMTADEVLDRIRTVVGETAQGAPNAVEVMSSSPPMLTLPEADLHVALCEAMGQQGDRAVSYATDAGFLQQAGFECVIWGPGDIARAHKPNEFIRLDELEAGRAHLDPLVARFCR